MALKQVKGPKQSALPLKQVKGRQQQHSVVSDACFIALKQVKGGQQSRTKDLRPSNKKELAKDPWSFLDCTEAPQWADLSLEESLIGEEWDDPWFHQSHKHHVVSLAGLNSDMTWLRLEHASRTKPVSTKHLQRKCSLKDSVTSKRAAGKENKPVKGIQQNVLVSKDAKYVNRFLCSEAPRCALPGDKYTSRTRSALSATSHTSKTEHSELSKSGSSSNARLRNTVGVRDSARESSRVTCWMNRESSTSSSSLSGVDENSVVFSATPTCSGSNSGASQKNRNSSGASFCPPGAHLRYSSEACLLNSNSLGLSSDTFLAQSVAATSGLASSEMQSTSGCGMLMDASASVGSKAQCGYDQFTNRDSTPENTSVNGFLIKCQQVARRVVKSEPIRVSDRRRDSFVHASMSGRLVETRVSLVGLGGPGKLFMSRTSNAQLSKFPDENSLKLSSLTECITERTAGSKGKQSPVVGCRQMQLKVDKRDHLQGSECTLLSSQSRNLCRPKGHAETMVYNQQKKTGLKGTPAGRLAPTNVSKAASSEQDLAALVAQHNRMVRTRSVSTFR